MVSGVTADDDFVYVSSSESSTVAVVDKKSGKGVRSIVLTGGGMKGKVPSAGCGKTNGALVVAKGHLFYGCSNSKRIYKYDLVTGKAEAKFIKTGSKIDVCAFDGQNMCVSDRGNILHCYRLTETNVYDESTEDVPGKSGVRAVPSASAAGSGAGSGAGSAAGKAAGKAAGGVARKL
jgi:outer membrane protein assembly factor BamB